MRAQAPSRLLRNHPVGSCVRAFGSRISRLKKVLPKASRALGGLRVRDTSIDPKSPEPPFFKTSPSGEVLEEEKP